jgi:hypothetical protein
LGLAFLLRGIGADAKDGAVPQLRPPVIEALNWLPSDVETVIVANGAVGIPTGIGGKPSFQTALELLPLGLASRVHGGLCAQAMQGHRVDVALEGSRRYRAPRGEGMMRYEGCQIIRFAAPAQGAVQRAAAMCLAKAPESIAIGDARVAVFRERWGTDEWTLLVSSPRPSVLLVATDRAFIEEVLGRIARAGAERALPDGLPQWRHVDTDALVWAIRHYRKESAENDPSSPLRPRGGANVPDPGAIGLTFGYDGETARVRYLTGAADALQVVSKGWLRPAHDLSPAVKEVERGVIEVSLPIAGASKERDARMFVFTLLAYLGHGVFV